MDLNNGKVFITVLGTVSPTGGVGLCWLVGVCLLTVSSHDHSSGVMNVEGERAESEIYSSTPVTLLTSVVCL